MGRNAWFHVNPSLGIPIYAQLTGQIRALVAAGAVSAGEPLPSVRELAVELAISPNTVARAYLELERSGWVEAVPGKGTFVAAHPSEHDEGSRAILDKARAVVRDALGRGMEPAEILELFHAVLAQDAGRGGRDRT
ncbi:MAG: GntR family transcriptional regulator [bacterium]|nr:GntR family transcriptional regulator [bacterium]